MLPGPAQCPRCWWDSLSAAEEQLSLEAEEGSWWKARSSGSAAAALGMWASLLLLLVVLMVPDPAGWALAVPLLRALIQPPAASDSSDTKEAKYVSSNLENRLPVQTARLRQNTGYLHGRDRGRKALAVNHSVALSAPGACTDPLCLAARAPDHKSMLVCK